MKLFQKILLAPAALGLMAPVAASAADLNIAGVSQYGSEEQVTSITQFSDVQPTDWAYQALSNLIERYGCVAGYPNGTFRGQRAMTRFEAAALLNACLDRITEVTDELKRLMKEFEKELAVLKGRVDGLEAKVAELEATQFSTTTKLSGQATFVVGGNAFWGSAVNRQTNTVNRQIGYYRPMVALPDAATFSYDLQLNLDTSFTGADLLRLNLRAGNFGDSVFGGEPHDLALSELEIAFQEDCGSADCGDVVAVNKLFYQWPLGGGFTATLGPRVGQEDMLALWPNVYPSDAILNVMTVNGAPAAYSKNRGGGAGLWWERDGFSVSANYVAARAEQGRPAQGGVANGFSGSTASLQLAYAGVQAGLALIWTRLQPDSGFVPGTTPFVHEDMDHNMAARTDAYGVSGYWQPMTSGWWPSLSVGWGMNQTRYTAAQPQGSLSRSQSWMVGLQWTDVFARGNDVGLAVAQPVVATSLTGGEPARDRSVVWECWYRLQVSDAVSVTPALIYLSRPLGRQTPQGESFAQFGGLIKTSIRF